MKNTVSGDLCDHCQRGRMVNRTQEIAFHQWTDKGYVYCTATIPVLICDECGTRTWDEQAEEVIERAVKEAYDKLP